jgi:hypothetical protein
LHQHVTSILFISLFRPCCLIYIHSCFRGKYCQAAQEGDSDFDVVRCNPGWVVDPSKSLPILIVVGNKLLNATCQERGYDSGSSKCLQHLRFNQALQLQSQIWSSSLSGSTWNNGVYW